MKARIKVESNERVKDEKRMKVSGRKEQKETRTEMDEWKKKKR